MRRRLIAAVLATLAVAVSGSDQAAGAVAGGGGSGEPQYDVARTRMARALTCPAELTSAREPVLLVHGTGLTPDESWSWNYGKLLSAAGFAVCTVELPHRAMTDIQVSAEYVAFAVDTIAARAHRHVAVLTHSQGGMEARWAVKWWASVRRSVADLVLLASPNHGIIAADGCADSGNCWPAVWQMSTSAHFIRALNRGGETPGSVAVTNLYSVSDELVEPSSTVPLSGRDVSNIAVQNICPRVVHHAGMLTDSVVYEVVIDALTHAGPGEARRVPPTVCTTPYAPGLTPADVVGGNAVLYGDAATQGFATAKGVSAEPALKPYARR